MTIALPRLDRTTAAERGLTLADFLVPIRVGERTPTRVRHIALIAAGAVIVALCAQVYIPTSPVPFTGQTFGVLVVGGALGFRRALAALLLYHVIAAFGIPVYSEGKAGLAAGAARMIEMDVRQDHIVHGRARQAQARECRQRIRQGVLAAGVDKSHPAPLDDQMNRRQ
jgi:hypothetical protein